MSTETVAPSFYDYREIYPFLEVLKENQDILTTEMAATCEGDHWVDWPETHLYTSDTSWDVIPFIAFGKMIDKNCERCPATTKILLDLPELRIAAYSRLGPKARLTPHYGLGPMANDALRVHFGLHVPEKCGIWVEEETRTQEVGEFIVFDDSKLHSGFNESDESRIVLIMDFNRPKQVPHGTSEFGMNEALNDLIDQFLPHSTPIAAQGASS